MDKVILSICIAMAGCGSSEWNPPAPSTQDSGIEDTSNDTLDDTKQSDAGTDVTLPSDDAFLFFSVNELDGTQTELEVGAPIEIVSGFQGGWHIDLLTKHKTERTPSLNGTQTYAVVIDGRTYYSSVFELTDRAFGEDGDFTTHRTFPFILDISSPQEIVSKLATISVTYAFDDGTTLFRELTVEIVDDVDEFG